jgi:Arc/MetJ-type ribon-helix-helix transcriptional regulator
MACFQSHLFQVVAAPVLMFVEPFGMARLWQLQNHLQVMVNRGFRSRSRSDYIRRSLERALEFSEAHEVPLLEDPELQRALAQVGMNTSDSDDAPARGPGYLRVLATLPEELQPFYQTLVDEYKFHAFVRYGRAWVAYEVIADLIKSGWRPTDPQRGQRT